VEASVGSHISAVTRRRRTSSDCRIVLSFYIDIYRGGYRGGAPPLFLAKSILLFYIVYTMSEKIFLKLSFDFIVADIRGVFASVGVYACVCVCV